MNGYEVQRINDVLRCFPYSGSRDGKGSSEDLIVGFSVPKPGFRPPIGKLGIVLIVNKEVGIKGVESEFNSLHPRLTQYPEQIFYDLLDHDRDARMLKDGKDIRVNASTELHRHLTSFTGTASVRIVYLLGDLERSGENNVYKIPVSLITERIGNDEQFQDTILYVDGTPYLAVIEQKGKKTNEIVISKNNGSKSNGLSMALQKLNLGRYSNPLGEIRIPLKVPDETGMTDEYECRLIMPAKGIGLGLEDRLS